LAWRPLDFIWICDSSGSMESMGKIQALNTAIRDAIPAMRRVAAENPNARVRVRAVRFADGASWHVAAPAPVEQFVWQDLNAVGQTDMGQALALVAQELRMPPMSERALPPVLVLISDGRPTDDFAGGLQSLLQLPWGRRAVRLAIAIGADAEPSPLRAFIANPLVPLLQAHNAETLVSYIRWASTVVVRAASAPPSQHASLPPASPVSNVPLPDPPPADDNLLVW
jgi:uncharacterized protein YegL